MMLTTDDYLVFSFMVVFLLSGLFVQTLDTFGLAKLRENTYKNRRSR